jgi:hypothetical protein
MSRSWKQTFQLRVGWSGGIDEFFVIPDDADMVIEAVQLSALGRFVLMPYWTCVPIATRS